MQSIVINQYGGYLHADHDTFLYKTESGMKKQISARDVDKFVLSTSIQISTDVLVLAGKFGIDMVVLDNYSEPISIIHPAQWSQAASIKRKQFEHTSISSLLKMDWIKSIVKQKIVHQRKLLSKYVETETENKQELIHLRNKIKTFEQKIVSAASPETMLGIEGASAAFYWQAYNLLLPETLRFESRTRRPAEDTANAALNYGYAILASTAHKALTIAGFNPSLGFYHVDRSGRPSMALDLMEIFRTPLVDQVFLTLSRRKQIKQEDAISAIGGGFFLQEHAKRLLAENYVNKLSDPNYIGKRKTIKGAVSETAYNWANAIQNNQIGEMWKWNA